MSASIKTYLAKNEFNDAENASVGVIELSHTCSIVRPFFVGDDWGAIRVSWRMCVSGSPDTGHLTGIYFFGGVCAGYNGRFRQSGNGNGNAIGWSANNGYSLTTEAGIAVTRTQTDPPNRNIGFTCTSWPLHQRSGSTVGNTGASGFSCFLSRYETVWSSSVGNLYPYLNNAFLPYWVSISKNSGSILNSNFTPVPAGQARVITGGPSLTYNPNISRKAFDHAMDQVIHTDISAMLGQSLWDWTGSVSAGGDYAVAGSDSDGGLRTFLNENESGSLNCINFYWRCDGNPNAKLLIKDIRIHRQEPEL